MNRQVNHIIHASLMLLLAGAGFFLIQRLSPTEKSSTAPTNIPISSEPASLAITPSVQQGKTLFMSRCASCHNLYKDMTGPSLLGFEERGPWKDRKKLYSWIRNPAAFIEEDEYGKKLFETYKSMMQAFPDLTDQEIDAICDYINYEEKIRASDNNIRI